MKKKVKRGFVYWFPRIFSIVFALFLMIFSFDVIGEFNGFWLTFAAFLIHSIPSIVLFVVIIIAWRYEIVGAITFILAGFLYVYLTLIRTEFEWFMLAWIVQIAFPAFFIGILFWVGWKRRLKGK